jgi:carbon-monoxide dehydrogenase catalytic subunit
MNAPKPLGNPAPSASHCTQAKTVWERASEAGPVCAFGAGGICCRICNMGPCRITSKTPCGVCGADGDTIAARNLCREIAAGAAAHSDHCRHLLHVFKLAAQGCSPDYTIKDERRLREVAASYGLATDGRTTQETAAELASIPPSSR